MQIAPPAARKPCPRASAARLLTLCAIAACTPACSSEPEPLPGTSLTTTYDFATLSTTLPLSIDVLTAIAAADEVVAARGYVAVGRFTSQTDARIRARFVGSREETEIHITCTQSARGTSVSIYMTPIGNHDSSRLWMQDIVARLMP